MNNQKVMNLGKCWAAIDDERVAAVLPMTPPVKEVDFAEFRERANSYLALFGTVRSGELILREGKRIFVQRLNHANRGKKPRSPKEFIVEKRFL